MVRVASVCDLRCICALRIDVQKVSTGQANLTNDECCVIPIRVFNGSVEAMSRALPPLTWFRAFEAAARHLSFTSAADELALTQSAVSQHVRALENRLGVPLFLRKPRGLALTDAGRRLLPEVSAALGRLAAASELFETGAPDGLLTVATSVSFAQWYLVPGMKSFVGTHEGARIRLISTIWPDDFRTSNADIEIRFGSRDLVGEGAEQLLPDELVAVASPKLLEGHETPSSDSAVLEQYPLIQAVGTSDDWKSWSACQGWELARQPTLFVDSHGLAVDLARSGAGIALTSSLLAAPCLADGSLVRTNVVSSPARDGYFLAVDARSQTNLVDAYVGWLKADIGLKVEEARPGSKPRRRGGAA